MSRPVWAEIDLDAIAHNVRAIKKILAPQTEIMAIVKANAYGHGAVPVARTALASGVTWLGVATLDEALALREEGITAPLLILGYTPAEDAGRVVAADLSQTVFSLEQARVLNAAAAAAGTRARLHLKIDTGMGRLGFLPDRAVAEALAIARLPHVRLEGIFTHFAAADAADKTYTRRQLALFQRVITDLEQQGITFPWRHAANSGAIIDLPETHFNLVRAGIILYGHYPSPEVRRERLDLRPAMTLKTRVVLVKEVPAGTYISYGCTYCTPAPARIATLPVGYADGYSRLLSNRAEVLIRGRRAPVIGRVCMDQCMIDVTAVPEASTGDEVVLFGHQGEQYLPVEEVAAWMGTINYEILCLISGRVPRVYNQS
ncbi:MAG: alanine racemase [Moorella sp. (in: firmicutes)]|uniref:alanine racemase n=1 Tax=unclassified Neomoorella TaxID=2676739 RepID=UPI0010FFAF41|nr:MULTISPECIES: alanine racemase [unclassified Moorella (in: firmicutes)]MDK2817488.1 alanine racemase [Moorella sp. (in: firmicutes)]GEA14093.1 alanine racemase [Moorella sp. E308F]GEA18531.1 alanine racemase [Moorella sp. E306M]